MQFEKQIGHIRQQHVQNTFLKVFKISKVIIFIDYNDEINVVKLLLKAITFIHKITVKILSKKQSVQ